MTTVDCPLETQLKIERLLRGLWSLLVQAWMEEGYTELSRRE